MDIEPEDHDSGHSSEQPEVDHDSDQSESEMDSDSDADHSYVYPVHADRAALLVARFAAAIQATKELQALQNRPQLLALEKLVLKCLDTGDAAFLNQKRLFRMMPPPLKEKINRECSVKWRHPPLVGELMDSLTRHLSLELDHYSYRGEQDGWTLENLEVLCGVIARKGKTSLQSLEISSLFEPKGKYPCLLVTQVGSLLLELRALTSLHIVGLYCSQEAHEIHLLVSILASTNPDIRSLRFPYLSNKSLCTIADRWPQLESLQPGRNEFDSSQVEAVLPRLKNLKTFEMNGLILSEALLKVARAHDPASPPYKLAAGFSSFIDEPVSGGDMVKVFTAFPALYWLDLLETVTPAVCAGLEGREHVHITELEVESTSANPRALEPLLALVGKHLTSFEVSCTEGFSGNRVDLNMVGHYCPKLEAIKAHARELISGDEFEVTDAYFSKLKSCDLHHGMKDHGPADLPDPLVCRVLASPTLSSCDLSGVPITEEVVAALAAASGEQGALSSLAYVNLWHHPSLDVEVLAELVSHAPRLDSLRLNACDEEVPAVYAIKSVLASFARQSRLKADVYKVDW